MANIFINGNEVEPKKDFDEKVNVNGNLSINANDEANLLSALNTRNDVLQKVNMQYSSATSDKLISNWGTGIILGRNNFSSALLIASGVGGAPKGTAQIATATNGDLIWHENIAWKSDITNLQTQIDALKKQIGGVLSSLLSHLVPRKVACLW